MTLTDVLQEAYRGFTTKSDFSRTNADFVAMAASQRLITTVVPWQRGVWSHHWHLTPRGLRHLYRSAT